MGELKIKGREGVKENQESYQEIQENVEQLREERYENNEILKTIEGVDDDDKANIEEALDQGKAIAEQLAQNQIENPKNEVNNKMENTVNEMKDLEQREKDDANRVSSMDGNYGGIGSSLESKFEDSANEFLDIVTSGEEIKEQSNTEIDNIDQEMRKDW